MSVICVTSNKGGVGKTTTAVSLAAALGNMALSTALVDLDPQGHAALLLGQDIGSGIYDWLVREKPVRNVSVHAGPCLTLIPGDSRTKSVDLLFRSEPGGFERCIAMLRQLPQHHTVIDTAAHGMLQEAALAAADQVVIPFRPETLGLDGVNATLGLVQRIAGSAAITILPVCYDKRLREHTYNINAMIEQYGDLVATPIPARVAVAEASAAGRTIWQYGPDNGMGEVRTAYTRLVERVAGQWSEKDREVGK